MPPIVKHLTQTHLWGAALYNQLVNEGTLPGKLTLHLLKLSAPSHASALSLTATVSEQPSLATQAKVGHPYFLSQYPIIFLHHIYYSL